MQTSLPQAYGHIVSMTDAADCRDIVFAQPRLFVFYIYML